MNCGVFDIQHIRGKWPANPEAGRLMTLAERGFVGCAHPIRVVTTRRRDPLEQKPGNPTVPLKNWLKCATCGAEVDDSGRWTFGTLEYPPNEIGLRNFGLLDQIQ